MSKNTGLQTLRVRMGDVTPHEHMRWIPNLLRLVNSPDIHTLLFELSVLKASQISGEHWDDIAWLISETPRFASLQRVRFIHRGILRIEPLSTAVRQQFPMLDLRRVLEFEDRRDPELCA